MECNTDLSLNYENLLANVVDRHSFFQLENFLINKEPTTQAKMWRCLREIQSREESLQSINTEIEEVNDNLTLLKIKKKRQFIQASTENDLSEDVSLEKQEKVVLERKINRKIDNFNKTINQLNKKKTYIQEEIDFIKNLFSKLNQKEELLPYDDERAQLAYWEGKLAEEFNISNIFSHNLSTELIKTILSLNNDSRLKISLQNHIRNMLAGGINSTYQISKEYSNVTGIESR